MARIAITPSWKEPKVDITMYRDAEPVRIAVRRAAAQRGISTGEYLRIAVDRELKRNQTLRDEQLQD